MFISNLKILSSMDSHFFMEAIHFLFIKIDIPLLALSFFFTWLKGVYNFPVFHFLFPSFWCQNYHIHLHYIYFSYCFHFISAALSISCIKFQSPVFQLESSISVIFPRLGVWFLAFRKCFLPLALDK